ncbi:MAG: hypothetical protein M1469_12255 [Bacteroidetes bacterium]|nr:hypothetical protein [Bacteroidota bacterium]
MRTTFAVMSLSLMVLLAACSKSSNLPTQPSNSQGTPDWTKHGFTTVIDSVTITPGTADSVVSGPYDIQIPANAFSSPVTFELLSGNPTSFSANAPSGETPILAFAFKVIDTQNDSLVGEFNNPVNITVTDSQITPQSWYYDILTNGSYLLNSTGMQLSAGQLTHPVHGAIYGWVITVASSTGSGGY